MADIKKINNYDLKDEVARNQIEDLSANKADKSELFSRNYNDLTNKPSIPSIAGLATQEYVDNKVEELTGLEVGSALTASDIIDVIEDNYFVSLNQFIPDGVSDHTEYIQQAINYCVANNKSLFIPDGEYYVSSTLVIQDVQDYTGFVMKGQSRHARIHGTHNDFIINVRCVEVSNGIATTHANRTSISNLTLMAESMEEGSRASGIFWESAQGFMEDVHFIGCWRAIYFDTACWCTNGYKLNFYNCHYALWFGVRSGGCYIDFLMMAGDGGYYDTEANGSVAITSVEGSHCNSIGDGGQISNFNYLLDIRELYTLALSVGRVYVEHNVDLYTPNSVAMMHADNFHLPAGYQDKNNSGVLEMTVNGINKTTVYNQCKDSAIPIFDLLAYFVFHKGHMFEDRSGNGATIENTDRLILADDRNLFGNTQSINIEPNGAGSTLNVPNLGNQFTLIMSFRQHDVSPMRIFELSEASNPSFYLMLVSGGGVTLTGSGYTNISVLNESPNTGDNAFVAYRVDLEAGTIHSFSPYYGMHVPGEITEIPELKNYANGNMVIDLFKAWSGEMSPVVLNYLAVFDGLLECDQLLNIYRQVKPLI